MSKDIKKSHIEIDLPSFNIGDKVVYIREAPTVLSSNTALAPNNIYTISGGDSKKGIVLLEEHKNYIFSAEHFEKLKPISKEQRKKIDDILGRMEEDYGQINKGDS